MKLYVVLWTDCLCPPAPNPWWNPNLQVDIRRWGLWEVIRSWGWNPHEWDQCSHKKDPREFSHPFHHVRMQWENSHAWTRKPVPWYWTPQSPELGEINVHYLSYLVYGIFFYSSENGVGHERTIKTPFFYFLCHFSNYSIWNYSFS